MTKKTIEQIETSLTRWKTRLRRAMTMIDKLEKQRKRLVKATTVRASVPAHPTVDSETTLGALPPPVEVCDPPGTTQLKPVPAIVEVDTSIPSFLRRTPDPVAEQIKAEQAETKRKKAAGRIATMKAKKAGETRKMPLTGRAALAAIRSAE
jgi:hypothetical protein